MAQRTSNLFRSPPAILLALMLMAAALPASAAVIISVEAAANAGGNGDQANNSGNEFPPNGAIHGVAAATRDSVSAFVADGGAEPCDFMPGVPGCAYELPQSRAMGEIRGDLGRLKAAVFADTDYDAGVGLSVAEVVLSIQDAIMTSTLGDLTFNLHSDIDVHLSGIESTLNENFFQLQFVLQPLVAGATATEFEFTLPEFQGGSTVVDQSFLFSALPANTQIAMRFDLIARNECGVNIFVAGGNTCTLWTDAGNTSYIGIQGDYVSLSGYAYPGFAGGPASVPEPATAGLLLAGLYALGAVRRRAPWRGPKTASDSPG